MSVHNLGGGFIPFDTEVNVSTTNTAYQTALNLAAGYGSAVVRVMSTAASAITFLKVTVNGNVVALDWHGITSNWIVESLYFVWSSAFKVEYKVQGGVTGECDIAYKNHT